MQRGLKCSAGLQTFVMTLQGSVVALASQGHLLAAVWHAALPAGTDDQCLQYAVFDISQQQQVKVAHILIVVSHECRHCHY